jgi:hypothetical protein
LDRIIIHFEPGEPVPEVYKATKVTKLTYDSLHYLHLLLKPGIYQQQAAGSCERLLDVLNDVIYILCPGGKTDQVFRLQLYPPA